MLVVGWDSVVVGWNSVVVGWDSIVVGLDSIVVGRDSVVGTRTRYRLNSPVIKLQLKRDFCTCLDWPWGPLTVLYNGCWVSRE